MQRFSCSDCGNDVHFENTACVRCGSWLGYAHAADRMLALPEGQALWHDGGRPYGPCSNRQSIGCNWLVADASDSLCLSCRFTTTIPDLSVAGNGERWARLEAAKRAVIYSLLKFRLPLAQHGPAAECGLRFEMKADELTASGETNKVMTGHDNGRITINIAEADDELRERHRVAMGEPYRTLIGHFRHELGHYYWDRLIACRGGHDGFRAIFGDERADYGQALKKHYASGPPAEWKQSYVSAYAASHPWEDFAETWSHYFHVVDGLETAASYGVRSFETGPDSGPENPYQTNDFELLLAAWTPLTVAMNAMNRSIGHRDFYPFVLSRTIYDKLHFVHTLVHSKPASEEMRD